MRNVVILGSTGSIGISTLSVLAAHPQDYKVLALTAASQTEKLLQQCLVHKPRYAAMLHEVAARQLGPIERALIQGFISSLVDE